MKTGLAAGTIIGGAGELETLERAWREAEQIAAIADALLLPGDVLERIAGLRKNLHSPGFAFS